MLGMRYPPQLFRSSTTGGEDKHPVRSKVVNYVSLAVEVLSRGVQSLAPFRRPDGELVDPIVGEPTQYGTPYHAWGNAVLAVHGPESARQGHLIAAKSGLRAALHHLLSPDTTATWSGVDVATGSARGLVPHRDFFWPPILKSIRLLSDHQLFAAGEEAEFRGAVNAVQVPEVFGARPPSNWAMVWMAGEWLRIVEGLSPHTVADVDGWLKVFADESFVPEIGFYAEGGLPNAYDLFTRVHLTELLVAGYDGAMHDQLLSFLTAGVQRSLAMQLSDGSLASGHRSASQTWNLGAQLLMFTLADRLGLGSDDTRRAAHLALHAMARWQRPGGPYSPVLNLHPPERRVGYEGYTADAHYSSLALGFLASAVASGIPPTGSGDGRGSVRIEHEPTYRATAHQGRISVGIQAAADGRYDGSGVVDLTFGPDARLNLVSSARHLSGGPWFNPGLAIKKSPNRTETVPLSAISHSPESGSPARRADDRIGVVAKSILATDDDSSPVHGCQSVMAVSVTSDGIEVTETLDHDHQAAFFLPYPFDIGDGSLTQVTRTGTGARLVNGPETLDLELDVGISDWLLLPADYRNRRAVCGLVRIDLEGPIRELRWRLRHTWTPQE